MTNVELIEKIKEAKKGKYIALTKTKDLGNNCRKESDMVIRLGVNYGKMSINEGKTTGSLPWGKWVNGLENLVIEHKGNYYLRVSSTTPENPDGADVIATRYYVGDKEVSKGDVEKLTTIKQGKASPVYNVKFENIVSLGK